MNKTTKTGKRKIWLISIIFGIMLLSVFTATAYHQLGAQEVVDIVKGGGNIAKSIIEASFEVGEKVVEEISTIDGKSIGFQKFVLIFVCTIAGLAVGWEVKSGGKKP